MPIYTFECRKCTASYDSVEKYSDMVLMKYPVCPSCGEDKDIIKDARVEVGGYQIHGNNSASTRPRGGAFKRG